MSAPWRQTLKWLLGPKWMARLRAVRRGQSLPRWGNLRRTRPFSDSFGRERGQPIDRHYLHRFLDQHRAAITGDVLEIQCDGYSRRFGKNLRRVDTLDIEPRFAPTYLCDLAHCEAVVPADSYDCFLLPNTLQHLRELDRSLRNALRVVRPGGVILASAAAFVPLIADGPDYWRCSALGWAEVARRAWPECEVAVEGHGNCLAAVAAILGLATEELTPAELDQEDSRCPVLVTLYCRKSPAEGGTA